MSLLCETFLPLCSCHLAARFVMISITEVISFAFWFVVLLLKTGPHCVTQANLKLIILLPLPLECWGRRHAPPHVTECDLKGNEVSLRKVQKSC